MTDDELNTAKQMIVEAFETRLLAAQQYTAALEFVFSKIDGDPETLKGARRSQNYCEHFLNSVRANMQGATVDDLHETFRVFLPEGE